MEADWEDGLVAGLEDDWVVDSVGGLEGQVLRLQWVLVLAHLHKEVHPVASCIHLSSRQRPSQPDSRIRRRQNLVRFPIGQRTGRIGDNPEGA